MSKRLIRDADPATSASSSASESNALLTKRQAAAYLQCTTRSLERAVAVGRLKALRPTPGLWRVRRSDLEAFLEGGSAI